MLLNFSENESKITGFRIFRNKGYLDFLNQENIVEDVKTKKVDVLRIKVRGDNELLFKNLNEIGYIYDVFTINYFNRGEIFNINNELKNDIFSVRKVLDVKADIGFLSILEDVLNSKSWFEYDSKYMNYLLPDNKKKLLALDYYSSFCSSNNSKGLTRLLLKNEVPVGIFMGYIHEQTYHGMLFGIHSKYRNLGYSKYCYHFMSEECNQLGVKYFQNDVNIFNNISQKSAEKQTITPSSIYYNITIYPFLNIETILIGIVLQHKCLEEILLFIKVNYSNWNIKKLIFKEYEKQISSKEVKLSMASPIDDLNLKLLVFHLKDNLNHLISSYYIEINS
jgi:hypothetical protein